MADYPNLKTLFYAEALKSAISRSTYVFKNKLKYIINNFIALYNKEITNEMLRTYSVDDQTFDTISTLVEQIGDEFSKIDIEDYHLILAVLKEFNEEKKEQNGKN